MSSIDATILVQVADEFARKKFNIADEEVWKLSAYNLTAGKLTLNYTTGESIVALKVELARGTVEGMAETYNG